ncbi:hypothetical protein GCM10027059_19880 [Myceligenerans halotolerans]
MTSDPAIPAARARSAAPGAARGVVVKEDDCVIFQRTLERAGRRWSGAILYAGVAGARRFVEYRRYVRGISDRLLTRRLRELEQQGFIAREVVPTMPVQILYTPTAVGAELVAAMQPLGEWGRKHYDLIEKATE